MTNGKCCKKLKPAYLKVIPTDIDRLEFRAGNVIHRFPVNTG